MSGNQAIRTTGSRTGVGVRVTSSRSSAQYYSRARCEYCRGWVADGDHREILVGEETKYVHRRHGRRDGEQSPGHEES